VRIEGEKKLSGEGDFLQLEIIAKIEGEKKLPGEGK
jgi:hypothetical protein